MLEENWLALQTRINNMKANRSQVQKGLAYDAHVDILVFELEKCRKLVKSMIAEHPQSGIED